MIRPNELYMDFRQQASRPLRSLMRCMGVEEIEDFGAAAARINDAGWSRLSGVSAEEREERQKILPDLRPFLAELGVLRPFPDQNESMRLQAKEMLWPGASARQVLERLRPGIRAISVGRLPNIWKITALAAVRRKPVGNELQYLPDLVADPSKCVEEAQVREGEMMRCVWERLKVDYGGSLLRHIHFDLVTTDMVPPEALHGRVTTLATYAAWWHRNQAPRCVVITSIAPYGYRAWCEASEHFPQCSWELIAPVPEEPSVVGAVSEVGKIVYNIAKRLTTV